MASTFKYPTNTKKPGVLNGRGVVFARPGDRKRVKLKLGRVTNAAAADVCRRIESLSRCAKLHTEPSGNAVEWLAGIADGLHAKLAGYGLTEPRVAPVEVPTLGEWCDSYIGERMGDLKRASVLILERTADLLREHFGGDTLIGNINADAARDWRAWLRPRPVGDPKPPEDDPKGEPVQRRMSGSTTRKHIRNAKAIFTAAGKAGLIPGDPFSGLSGTSLASKTDRHISAVESEAIIDAMPNGDYRLIFALALYGGLRCPSESHTLRWGDINWDRGRMLVRSVKIERFCPAR